MIKLINRIIPLFSLCFVLLVGVITIPTLVQNIEDTTNTIYGATKDDFLDTQAPPDSETNQQTAPEIKENTFSEAEVTEITAKMVSEYGLGSNGFTPTGGGAYTIHLYGNKQTLSQFLQDFGECEMHPTIGEFSLKESGTYFFLMNSMADNGVPLLFYDSIYGLLSSNDSVKKQIQTISTKGISSDYYLIMTFSVPLDPTV